MPLVATLPGRSLERGGSGAGLPRIERGRSAPAFVGVSDLNEEFDGGRCMGAALIRLADGERVGDIGVGTARVGIEGIGGTAGTGVREREGVVVADSAGERERMGVEEGVWMGSGCFSRCGRNAGGGGRAFGFGFSTRRLSNR